MSGFAFRDEIQMKTITVQTLTRHAVFAKQRIGKFIRNILSLEIIRIQERLNIPLVHSADVCSSGSTASSVFGPLAARLISVRFCLLTTSRRPVY